MDDSNSNTLLTTYNGRDGAASDSDEARYAKMPSPALQRGEGDTGAIRRGRAMECGLGGGSIGFRIAG